jgi:hypothetical protein
MSKQQGEVTLTRAQAAKVYDRAFAGRESELHEGHPSWHAFQRFLKAGYGPAQPEAPTAVPEEQPGIADLQVQELVARGLTEHEAKLILAARSATRVQGAPEGTIQGYDADTRRLEQYHQQARSGGFSGGSY